MRRGLRHLSGMYVVAVAIIFLIGCSYGFSINRSDDAVSVKYSTDIDSLLLKHDLCVNGYSASPDSAVVYTVMALHLTEDRYGFGSREYVDIISDYMIPDCKDYPSLLTDYLYPLVTIQFCQDSIYVAPAYFELGRVLSNCKEYSKADTLFSLAAERVELLVDSLTVEVEKAINWQNSHDGVLYEKLYPLIGKTESLESPDKENLLFRIYSLLARHYEDLQQPGYPDSPMGFIKKALEYFDYGSLSDKMSLLYEQYRFLLSYDHREAIKCIDRMLGMFEQDDAVKELDWHVLAYMARGDYCLNENLDVMGALDYYMAANSLLSAPVHDGLRTKWAILDRMQRLLRHAGHIDLACHCGEILVDVSTRRVVDAITMGYVVSLSESYLSAEKFDQAKIILDRFKDDIMRDSSLDFIRTIMESRIAMHEQNYDYALEILKSLAEENSITDNKLIILRYLLEASSHCAPLETTAYADSINKIVFSNIRDQLLRISPSARRNWQLACGAEMQAQVKAANLGAPVATQLLKMSLFRKGLLFRTANEIGRNVANNPHTAQDWKLLISLRDSVNRFVSTGDRMKTRQYALMADSVEWGLSYSVVNDKNLYSSLNPDIDAVLDKLGSDDVAFDFISINSGDNSAYCAVAFGKSLEPTYIPLFEMSDSINHVVIDTIWNGLLPYLNQKGRMYFCADGFLNNIGIEFIKDVDGVQMAHKYNLHRVFNLADIQQHDGIGDKVVAIGVSDHNSPISNGETFYRGNMTDLPNVIYEMQLIGQRFAPERLTILLNDDATESAFKGLDATDVSGLHISTHGIYRNYESLQMSSGNPDDDDYHIAQRMLRTDKKSLSGLILRQGNLTWKSDKAVDANDDILMAEEIENMTFPNLQLTVLSACDSGLGDIDTEGVWGLQRAFRIAGSKSLICSLRKVDDYWTAQFMDAFYEHVAGGNTIYDAFHEAQRWQSAELPDEPEIWSSFILIE